MADIKTRDVVKGTIKKIDKAAIAADRMRSAYVQTKEKAEHTTPPDEHNAEEYASDRVDKKLRPVISIRIFRETKCFGPGVAELLRHVREARHRCPGPVK